MIHYVVRRAHAYTIEEFLAGWGRDLRPAVTVVPYEAIFARRRLAAGAYLFSDLERLTSPERALAADLFERLVARGVPALNHPRRAQTRFGLLQRLADLGLNPFRAHRLDPRSLRRYRYPVFLRTERAHDGNLTPLLHDPGELLRALAPIARHPLVLRAGLLVVELEDTRDASGLYRKYSVLRVGPAFVPRHAFVGRAWMLKHAEIVDEATARDELTFVREFPYREQVRRAFDAGGIDYGRMDFSVRDGRIVVWEINTNPVIVPDPSRLHPLRVESQRLSAARAVEAFQALAATAKASDADIAGARARHLPLVLAARLAARLLG